MSEIRSQRSEAVQAGFTRCNGFAVNRISYPVGAGLRSDIRSQKSDIRCGTSWFHALQRLRRKPNVLSRRGGSLRPPEQSSGRKQLVSVIKIVILISAVTDWKNQLSCGRALKTRPYNGCVTFSRRHCCVESSRTDSVRRIPPAATMGFLPFFRIL